MPNFALSPVHPWAVRLHEGLLDQEMLPGLLPFGKCTGFFTGIVHVDAKFRYAIFSNHVIERITTVSLAPHGDDNHPILVIAKELSIFIAMDRLGGGVEHVRILLGP